MPQSGQGCESGSLPACCSRRSRQATGSLEELERSLGEPLCGGGGDLLEGPEVHVEPGSVVPEGPLRDDPGPLAGEFVELLQFLRCEVWRRHGSSCLAVASIMGWGFPIPPS